MKGDSADDYKTVYLCHLEKLSEYIVLSPHSLYCQLMSALQTRSYSCAYFQNLLLRSVQKLDFHFVLITVKSRISSTEINVLCVENKCMWIKHEHTPVSSIQRCFCYPHVPPFRDTQPLQNGMFCVSDIYFNCNDLAVSKCQRPLLESYYCSRSFIFDYLVDFSST